MLKQHAWKYNDQKTMLVTRTVYIADAEDESDDKNDYENSRERGDLPGPRCDRLSQFQPA